MRSTQFHDIDTTDHNQEPETEFRNYRAHSSDNDTEVPSEWDDRDLEELDIEDDDEIEEEEEEIN